jgi:hypothetical protein
MRTRKKQQPTTGKPQPRRFSRSNPCTKLDLWNAFRGKRGFIRVQVDVAHSMIGLNAPRYMLKNGYLEHFEQRNVEFYRLTADGEYWLYEKFSRLTKKHPEWLDEAANLPAALRT